jgi:hypothetical protein
VTTTSASDGSSEGHAALALRRGDRHDGQMRREGGELAQPRAHDARRCDHEDRPGSTPDLAAVVRPADGGDDLHRLAEAHVVGEDASDVGVPKTCEPTESVELVGTQGGAQVRRHLGDGPLVE